jgi:hypothetical protein
MVCLTVVLAPSNEYYDGDKDNDKDNDIHDKNDGVAPVVLSGAATVVAIDVASGAPAGASSASNVTPANATPTATPAASLPDSNGPQTQPTPTSQPVVV